MQGFLTTAEAATKLGVSRRRVLAMIKAGQIEAEAFGGSWAIRPGALDAVRDRKPGRPWHKEKQK